jgi:hypothetical protein
MQDIVSNMFSERFLEEIFRPQEACSRKTTNIDQISVQYFKVRNAGSRYVDGLKKLRS